ncbi:MAG: 4-(cytidine 5'-diphospho)-2-C-methyl-D-erythritol kinase [Thermodesulfobacteriota bacterium]
MTHLTIPAPAKINLYLAILGKRPDGYHTLATEMVKLALCDRIHLARRAAGIAVECPGSPLSPGPDNLVHRAASRFLDRLGEGGVRIVLEKQIPIAAGLGGGSSDAAAVLLGMNSLWGSPFEQEQLVELARPLGADVPFFVVECEAAWATGIGDLIQPNQVTIPGWVVLVNPGFSVSTKWVYENFALTKQGVPDKVGREFVPGTLASTHPWEVPLRNDLEAVTINRHPELARIKEELLASGASGALMSGSGPTVFGLFAEQDRASQCAEHFAGRYGGNVFLTRPLGAS